MAPGCVKSSCRSRQTDSLEQLHRGKEDRADTSTSLKESGILRAVSVQPAACTMHYVTHSMCKAIEIGSKCFVFFKVEAHFLLNFEPNLYSPFLSGEKPNKN